MLLFAHIGITIGIFFLIGLIVPSLRQHIRYRYVALGALLPDLIDKPIGRLIFADFFSNGRIFAHTLLFFIVILIISWYIYSKRKDSRLLVISAASFCHLLEDRMWLYPRTILWPLYGWDFPAEPSYENGLSYLWLMFNRSIELDFSNIVNSDTIGLLIILLLIVSNLIKKK